MGICQKLLTDPFFAFRPKGQMDLFLPVSLLIGGIVLLLIGICHFKFPKFFMRITRGTWNGGVPISEENARQRNLFSGAISLVSGFSLLIYAVVVYLAHGALG